MTITTGTCHCGETEWEVETEGEPVHIFCHCNACKILSGGPFTLNVVVPKENVKVTKGDLKVYTYKADSGNDTDCYHCGTCTAHPFHHQKVNADKYVVRTGLLKGADSFKVAAEVYAKDRFSWQPQIPETSFETTPQ